LVVTGNDGMLKLPEGAIEFLLHISDKEDLHKKFKNIIVYDKLHNFLLLLEKTKLLN
jgi:hypothetical protein